MSDVSVPSLQASYYDNATAKNLVEAQYDTSGAYADQAWSAALGYISDLDEAQSFDLAIDVSTYSWPGTIQKPSIEPAPSMGDTPDAPGEMPYPDAPSTSNIEDSPSFTDSTTAPSETGTPTAPGSIDVPDVPTPPSAASSPGDPDISSISTAGKPDSSMMTWQESPFASFLDLSGDLRDKISLYVNGTETGVDAAVEEAINDRAMSRLNDELEAQYTQAESYWSARGFSMPPGMLAGQLTELSREHGKRVEELQNDIYVRQVQDAKEYFFNALSTAVQYGQLDLAAMQAKSQFVVDKFKNLVAVYAEEMAARRAQAEIDVAIYQAELQRYKTESDVNMAEFAADVEAFKARVQALTSVYEAEVAKYKSEGEFYNDRYNALIALYQAERGLDIEGFKADIDNVRYRNASLMDKDKTKAQVYASEMGAKADVYKSRIQAYQGQVSAVVDKFRGEVANYQAQIQKYQAEGTLNVEQVKAQLEEIRVKSQVDIQNAQAELSAAVEAWRIHISAIEAQATTTSQLAASALGVLNVSAGVDHSVNMSSQWRNSWSASAAEHYNLRETK